MALALACAIGLGVGLRLETLACGFRADDYVQLAMLEGRFPIARAPWDLYWFGGRDAAETAALIDSGYLPWWTHPEHRVAMLRPLSSLLLALDHALFGHAALGHHLHALLWLAALIGAVGALLFRLLPPGVAALALLLYALDEAHGIPTAWIANRSTLIATTLGVVALHAHLRARERGETFAPWSIAWLLASLAAGEYGLCLAGYFVAYELLGRREPLSLRLRALGPAALACLAYLSLRGALGYGARNSGFYLSPFETPLAWLQQGVLRGPALAGDLTLAVPAAYFHAGAPARGWLLERELFDAETWRALPDWPVVQAGIGVVGMALALWLLRWLARCDPEHASTRAWLLAGSLLALLVPLGSLPGSRLLAAAALGVAVLLASFVWVGFAQLAHVAHARHTPLAALLFVTLAVHGVLAGERALARAHIDRGHADGEREQAARAPLAGPEHAYLISASDFVTAAHLPLIRALEGAPARPLHRLSGALMPHDVLRTGPSSLELRVLGSDLAHSFAGSLYRPRRAGFAVGQRLSGPGMRVEVLAVREGNPTQLRFDFDRPIDALTLLHAGPDGLVPLALPQDGAKLRLPRATVAWDLQARSQRDTGGAQSNASPQRSP